MLERVADEMTATFARVPGRAASLVLTARGRATKITTGASLRSAGAIGLGCGTGRIPQAATATMVVVAIRALFRRLETSAGLHRHEIRCDRDDADGPP